MFLKRIINFGKLKTPHFRIKVRRCSIISITFLSIPEAPFQYLFDKEPEA